MSTERPILVAEDDNDDFYFFERAVRTALPGTPIVRFEHGGELVDYAEKVLASTATDTPSLLFLDISMPVMNGFEVLAWLQRHPTATSFRVFVLSGSNRHEDKARACELGAHGYVVKPISAADVARIAQAQLAPPVTEGGIPA